MIRFFCFLAATAFAAGPAGAHGTLAGGGGFYAGAAHPFLAWEHLLLLIALGLILGRPPRAPGRVPIAVLALALGAGLALASREVVWPAAAPVILISAMLGGGVLALSLALPVAVRAVFAAAAGLAIGLDTGVPVPQVGAGPVALLPFAGVVVGVFLIVLNTMALASVAVRPPFSIAIRVAGSWIVAVALMVLALELRPFGVAA